MLASVALLATGDCIAHIGLVIAGFRGLYRKIAEIEINTRKPV